MNKSELWHVAIICSWTEEKYDEYVIADGNGKPVVRFCTKFDEELLEKVCAAHNALFLKGDETNEKQTD